MRPPKPAFQGIRQRRASEDPVSFNERSFIIDVEKTKADLLDQEDTDQNFQITVQDGGTLTSLSLFYSLKKDLKYSLWDLLIAKGLKIMKSEVSPCLSTL